ncbi:hypothetical protein ACFX15_006310 [Malus domestica]
MSGPSDRRLDLNSMPSQDNIWRPSFLSPTGPLIVRDSVMKNDMTAAVVARNLLTPKDNKLLSKRLMSWLLRILWLLVFNVQVLCLIWPNTYLFEPAKLTH